MPGTEAGAELTCADRGVEIGACGDYGAAAIDDERAVHRSEFAKGLNNFGVVNAPRGFLMALQRIQGQLAQERRKLPDVA
jgi:hypothetical protein